MGHSGSGKGTQARLLNEYLSKASSDTPLLYIETGARFRDFITQEGYTNTISDRIMKEGGRQPDFLAVWNWADILVRDLKEDGHLVLDGVARSLQEAQMLDTAIDFYNRSEVYVFFLNTSPEWAKQKAVERGRAYDLNPGEHEVKLQWFKEKVVPAIEFFKGSPRYSYVEINGEQSIEEVHADILASIQW